MPVFTDFPRYPFPPILPRDLRVPTLKSDSPPKPRTFVPLDIPPPDTPDEFKAIIDSLKNSERLARESGELPLKSRIIISLIMRMILDE